jgi:hypothetical protein
MRMTIIFMGRSVSNQMLNASVSLYRDPDVIFEQEYAD